MGFTQKFSPQADLLNFNASKVFLKKLLKFLPFLRQPTAGSQMPAENVTRMLPKHSHWQFHLLKNDSLIWSQWQTLKKSPQVLRGEKKEHPDFLTSL